MGISTLQNINIPGQITIS